MRRGAPPRRAGSRLSASTSWGGRLRLATPADADRLWEIKREATDADFLRLTYWRTDGVVRHLAALAEGADPLVVAEREGRVEGFFHGVLTDTAWHLNDIAVAPEAQGEGIGRELFQAFEELRATIARPQRTLDVDEENLRARRWYERRGYSETGRRELVAVPLDRFPTPSEIAPPVPGLEQALAQERERGFSQIEVVGERIGLIAGDTLRYVGPAAKFSGVAATLRSHLPDRTLIVGVLDGPFDTDSEIPRPEIRRGLARLTQRCES